MALARSDLETLARQLFQDVNAIAVSDTVLDSMLDNAISMVLANGNTRPKALTGTAFFTATSADGHTLVSTPTDVLEVQHVYCGGAGAVTEPEMERVPLWRWSQLYNDSAVVGRPTHYALVREHTATAADVGKWTIHYWPPSDANGGPGYKFAAHVIVEEPAMSADTTKANLTDEMGRVVAHVAAFWCAHLKGEDAEFCDRIIRFLPERFQSLAIRHRGAMVQGAT